MNNNLGANYADKNHANFAPGNQATDYSDANALGDMYQWGRGSDGHESRTSGTTTTTAAGDDPGHGDFILINGNWRTTANDALWQGVDGTNNPCPTGYRIPTEAEFSGLGYSNAAATLNSPLKLLLTGYRTYASDIPPVDVGTYAFYWASTTSGSNAYAYRISSNNTATAAYVRSYGHSVRCIKD